MQIEQYHPCVTAVPLEVIFCFGEKAAPPARMLAATEFRNLTFEHQPHGDTGKENGSYFNGLGFKSDVAMPLPLTHETAWPYVPALRRFRYVGSCGVLSIKSV